MPDGNRNLDDLPQLAAAAEIRIGSVDNPDVGFSQLAAADVDSDGNVYALEAMGSQIRVYGTDGRLIRRIGRSGSGPGEFEDAPRHGVRGDTLWTYDMAAGRITLFDLAGKVLSTGSTHGLRIPLYRQYGYVLPVRMRPDGLFTGWLSMVGLSRTDPPSSVSQDSVVPVPRIVFNAAGEVVDTIGWLPSPPPRMVPPPHYEGARFERIVIGGRPYLVPDPPSTLPTWLPLDDGHIVVDVPYASAENEGTFTITRIGLNGDTTYHRTFTYRPTRYTAEDLDSVAARGSRGYGNSDTSESERRAAQNVMRATLKFPTFKLPIRYAWLAQDEGLWLLRDDAPGTPARWVVLNRAGEPRGELQLATLTRPLWNRGDIFWVAEHDDNDVPWLVRYRIANLH